MNDITYGVIQEIHTIDEENRVSYGVAAYSDFESDGSVTVIASVRDVTPDRQKIEDLVKKCNSGNLAVCHLNDVVEDFLNF